VHVVGPDVGTHAALFAASNHPGIFASAIIGSATIDYTKAGDGLNLLVNSPSTDAFKDLTGPQSGNGGKTLENYKIPQNIYQDFLQSYEGPRFLESVAFLRAFPGSLPILEQRLRSIDMPCLVIAGRKDPFVIAAECGDPSQRVANNRLVILETGHSTWEDRAADYAQLGREWITGGYHTLNEIAAFFTLA
jgi:pimeloyl-ACP methyl ester carboxylesterase